MHLTEDISNFLSKSSDSGIIMFLKFKGKDIKLETVKDKLRVVQAWRNTGVTDENLEIIKGPLGPAWEAYIHPHIAKLETKSMRGLIFRDFDFTYMNGMEVVIKEILHKKMGEFLEFEGITSLASETYLELNTASHKIVTYKVKSKYASNYLWGLSLEWSISGFKISSTFLNTGTHYEAELSKESSDSIKEVMYNMTNGQDLELSLLNGIIHKVKYVDPILDCFMKNLISYTKY